MERPTSNLEAIAQVIRANFSAKDQAREKAFSLCREVTRLSGKAIYAVHRGEFAQAESLLKEARQLLNGVNQALAHQGGLADAPFVHNAQKEYAEGCATLALVLGNPLPEPEILGVSYPAYLNGLGEAVGEIRRYLLDSIRRGDLSRSEELLAVMDDIYGVLVSMDFPDALTYGLRRTTDVVRGVLEKTRGDLTLAIKQRDLIQQLEGLEKGGKAKLEE